MKKIALIGTFDTKGREFKYLKEAIEAQGAATLCVDAGVYPQDVLPPDISNAEVARAEKLLSFLRE